MQDYIYFIDNKKIKAFNVKAGLIALKLKKFFKLCGGGDGHNIFLEIETKI